MPLPYFVSLALVKFMRFAGKKLISKASPQAPARSIKLPSSKKGLELTVDVYEPATDPRSSDSRSPLPLVINLAGAAFCLDTLGSDSQFCQRVADVAQCVVLDLDYAKAPERPWPNATEDVLALVHWLRSEGAEKHGWDGSRVAITGFSSGGCIALLAATQLDGFIKACCVLYPSTDLATPPEKKPHITPDKGANGSELPVWLRRFFYSLYLPQPGLDWSDPRISPKYADVEAYPPTTIVTCEKDALGQEGKEVVEKLKSAGKDVVHWEVPGQGHGWDKQPGAIQIEETYGLAAQRIKKALHPSSQQDTAEETSKP